VVEDYQLAPSYHSTIVKLIQEQLNDYKAHSALYDGEGGEYLGDDNDPSLTEKGILDEEDAAWWEGWRKRLRTEFGFVQTGKGSVKGKRRRKAKAIKIESGEDADNEDETPLDDEKSMAVEEFEIDEGRMTEDMRIIIKLDIIVGSMRLDDQFEWDIDNFKASPEQFAELYAKDLGLNGEFCTAIAHSIREQVQTHQKSLFLIGRPSDGSIQDEDLRSAFLPSISEGARTMDQVHSFTPVLYHLSDGELEKNEKERDKDMTRRRKRNNRGRKGINLPDREPIRTYRTPAIGFPELDAATLALAAAANAPVSRRAAAAAASLTIANMVASENGTPLTPLTVPTAPQPTVAVVKEKKVKGLFKSPPVPSSVIRPRAKISAPTPSTAADVSKLPVPLENDPPPSINVPDRFLRPLSVRRTKDQEREAKDKEHVDGQHANYIDGVWHCSNCGCPENIAVGRRKGPLGDKSQCGDCGKFWHRHRRPRPCTYSTDPDYHNDLKRETEVKSKKKGTAALRAQGSVVSTPAPDDSSAPPTPARDRKKEDSEAPSRQSPPPSRRAIQEEDRAMSPMSSASSVSEPPLSQRVKITNGTATEPPSSPSPSRDSKLADTKESKDLKEEKEPELKNTSAKNAPSSTLPKSTAQSPPTSPTKSWPPQWLTSAMHATQMKYPHDKFDVVLRKVGESGTAEWRIKCVDCPGKLYKPGPGETLSNFEVHLKNRQHRQRVDDRTAK
jgi:SWI/SNF-related matrix-associated actin-dependent regulator of chromatin subfamily B member 1